MSNAGAWRVLCTRADGDERLYHAYAAQQRANEVAAALRKVGCPCRVVGPEELALESPAGPIARTTDRAAS